MAQTLAVNAPHRYTWSPRVGTNAIRLEASRSLPSSKPPTPIHRHRHAPRCQAALGAVETPQQAAAPSVPARTESKFPAVRAPTCLVHVQSQVNAKIMVVQASNAWFGADEARLRRSHGPGTTSKMWCELQFPEKANPPILNGCRALFLNAGGNVHSMIRKDRVLTGEVWDQLAILPGLVPEGPVGLLGLGAATVAHIIRRYWPERVMHGWELDAKVLDIAREYLEMSRLEGYGCLVAHVGDALSDEATVEGGFAGVIVDIFADNALVPALTQEATWRSLRSRLRPGGRIITNLGLVPSTDLDAPAYQTLRAMHRVFDGAVMVHELESDYTLNMLALTGKPLGEADWQASLPADLVPRPGSWRPWHPPVGPLCLA